MKEGYIVWNNSNCGPEFFGVYRSEKQAIRQFRKVIRNRFGKCPRCDYDELIEWVVNHEDGDDGYEIRHFEEYDGEWEGTI